MYNRFILDSVNKVVHDVDNLQLLCDKQFLTKEHASLHITLEEALQAGRFECKKCPHCIPD